MEYRKIKIRVKGAEEFEAVQKILFENGVTWYCGGKEVQYTDSNYLFVDGIGYLTHDSNNNDSHFNDHAYKEVSASEILGISDFNFEKNTMQKKVYKVLIINKKTSKTIKNENVVAVDEQQALLKVFDVDAENSFIKIEEEGSFEVKETSTVILKEEKKK